VSEMGYLDPSGLVRIQFGEIRESHRLVAGDIVFRSRGTKVICSLVPELPLQTLLAAPLFRIRATDSAIDPLYLAWYINQLGRSHLESRSEGSDLKMVSVQSIKELEVVVPNRRLQANVVEIAALAREELQLVEAIVQKRSKLISSCLARTIQEN
jgi:restriction endonuclease S subunit